MPDFRGDTAVHATSINGHTACLQLLLQSGAEVDMPNRKGQLATHLARNNECMQTLVDHSGDVFGVDHVGRTTLFVACSNGRESALHCLLDLDEDQLMLNLADDRGDTPLHAASCNGHVGCVRLLLQTMADPSITNSQSLLPGYLAECNGHIDVVVLLEEYSGYTRQTDMANAVSGSSGSSGAGEVHPNNHHNWSEAVDEHGTTYYWHHETGESRWEPPEGWQPPQPQQPQLPQQPSPPLLDNSTAVSPLRQYGSPTASSNYGSPHYGGEEEYWGTNGGYSQQHDTTTTSQQWGDWATEGYDYTNEWEEYWQWYGYEQQEEAPRYNYEECEQEWTGYYDDAGNWVDTTAETQQQQQALTDLAEQGEDVPPPSNQPSSATTASATTASATAGLIPRKLNKNYGKMAKDYLFQAPYRVTHQHRALADTADTEEQTEQTEQTQSYRCMVCHKNSLSKASVLLPCEHRSVCNACIAEHGYGVTSRKASESVGGGIIKLKPKQCPACKKRVYKVVSLQKFFNLPRDFGPAPRLTKHFTDSLVHAGAMLKEGKVPDNSGESGESGDSGNMVGGGDGGGAEPPQKKNRKKLLSKKSPVSQKKPKIPLVVTFGEGPIGLELVPFPNKEVGSWVKSVSGAAKEGGVLPKMKLLKVNEDKVDQLAFSALMKLLQKSGRPIKMLFLR